MCIRDSHSSAPSSLEASKCADYYDLLPGHRTETADAEQAYTQAKLGGTKTWVRLPKHRWPKAWVGKSRDPVVLLILALYGHPDSGGYWEQKCDQHVKSMGCVAISDWRSCYFHNEWSLFLVIYVDDFKLTGPVGKLAAAWKALKKGLNLDTPTGLGKFLGCEHTVGAAKLKDGKLVECGSPALPGSGGTHSTMNYQMRDFLVTCVKLSLIHI